MAADDKYLRKKKQYEAAVAKWREAVAKEGSTSRKALRLKKAADKEKADLDKFAVKATAKGKLSANISTTARASARMAIAGISGATTFRPSGLAPAVAASPATVPVSDSTTLMRTDDIASGGMEEESSVPSWAWIVGGFAGLGALVLVVRRYSKRKVA